MTKEYLIRFYSGVIFQLFKWNNFGEAERNFDNAVRDTRGFSKSWFIVLFTINFHWRHKLMGCEYDTKKNHRVLELKCVAAGCIRGRRASSNRLITAETRERVQVRTFVDLWWTKWHWDVYWLSPVNIIPPLLHMHSCIEWGMDKGTL